MSAFFGHKDIPIKVKAILSFSLAILILPLVPPSGGFVSSNLLGIILVLFKEVSFGVLIGFASLLIFVGIQLAGQLIGFQMGFAIVNVIDPGSQIQISIIAEFKYLVAMMIYLSINGHYFLISAIAQSFQLIPPGKVNFTNETGVLMTRMVVDIFNIGLKIGAPAIIALFLTSVSLGIIARTVPQMNVFIVGFPLKIGVGLMILAAALPYFGNIFYKLLMASQINISNLIMINVK